MSSVYFSNFPVTRSESNAAPLGCSSAGSMNVQLQEQCDVIMTLEEMFPTSYGTNGMKDFTLWHLLLVSQYHLSQNLG